MKHKKCICDIRQKGGFKSYYDFERHENDIQESQIFTQAEVKTLLENVGFIETWHKCNECFKVWRLVEPDVPFKGYWSVVPENDF